MSRGAAYPLFVLVILAGCAGEDAEEKPGSDRHAASGEGREADGGKESGAAPLTGDAARVPYREKTDPYHWNAYDRVPMKVRERMHPLQKELLDKLNELAAGRRRIHEGDYPNRIAREKALREFDRVRGAWARDWSQRVIKAGVRSWVFRYHEGANALGFGWVGENGWLISVPVARFDVDAPEGKALLEVRDGGIVFVSLDLHPEWGGLRGEELPFVSGGEKASLNVGLHELYLSPRVRPRVALEPIARAPEGAEVPQEVLDRYTAGVLAFLRKHSGPADSFAARERLRCVQDLLAGRLSGTAGFDAVDAVRRRVLPVKPVLGLDFPLDDPRVGFLVAKEVASAAGKLEEYRKRTAALTDLSGYPVRLDETGAGRFAQGPHRLSLQATEVLPQVVEYDVRKQVYLVRADGIARIRELLAEYQAHEKALGTTAERRLCRRGVWSDVVKQSLAFWRDKLRWIEEGKKAGTVVVFEDSGPERR